MTTTHNTETIEVVLPRPWPTTREEAEVEIENLEAELKEAEEELEEITYKFDEAKEEVERLNDELREVQDLLDDFEMDEDENEDA